MTFRGMYDGNERQEQRELEKLAREIDELEGAESLEIRLLLMLVQAFAHLQDGIDQILAKFPPSPALTTIQLQFGGITMALGPVTMNVGQKTKATVQGFDQNGLAFTGTLPTVTYTIDNAALNSGVSDGANGFDITSLASGVANLTASVTTAEGLALSDVEQITNSGATGTSVLTSIKVDFTTPA